MLTLVFSACHIGEMEQISQVFAGIKEQFGRLDIQVNNAATNPPFCNVLDTDLSAFQKTLTSTSAATSSCRSAQASGGSE
ncbi:SDR family oxidoreductase [Pseudomonas sp. S2_H10]